tara:strand:- start:25 stop:525 length:501 start_codon:yes stop_codon:yes gene_type:complete
MKNLTIIGIRLIALFVFVRAIMSLEIFTNFFFDDQSTFSEYWFYFLPSALYTLISIILFFGSRIITNYIIPTSEDQDFLISNYQKLSAVLFSTAGLFIVYLSIQNLFQSVATIIQMNAMYPNNPDMKEFRTITIIFGGFIQLITGILLFIGGKKLSKWWYDFRNWT